MVYYTDNEIRINQCIVDIFTEGLIENFIENDMENNIDTTDITIDEYLRDEVIENIFNRETCNILNYWSKKYTLDCKCYNQDEVIVLEGIAKILKEE